jgi:DNA-binding MarR family transcriptional regulator
MRPVPRRLRAEIKQGKPFAGPEEELFVSVLRLADQLTRGVADVVKPFGLTPTQYNILRILRGAGKAGLACGEIGERMITRDPDITRLLDRLSDRGLVERGRDSGDRRVVLSRITREGVRLLAPLDALMEALHRQQLAHVGKTRLGALLDGLEVARRGG